MVKDETVAVGPSHPCAGQEVGSWQLAVGRKKIKEERLRMKEKIGFKGSRGQGFEGQYHLSPGILESSICE